MLVSGIPAGENVSSYSRPFRSLETCPRGSEPLTSNAKTSAMLRHSFAAAVRRITIVATKEVQARQGAWQWRAGLMHIVRSMFFLKQKHAQHTTPRDSLRI
jgi:hypothetical protein